MIILWFSANSFFVNSLDESNHTSTIEKLDQGGLSLKLAIVLTVAVTICKVVGMPVARVHALGPSSHDHVDRTLVHRSRRGPASLMKTMWTA